ncbi:protein phosphatase 1 regulatory subunit 7-like [Clytia hemisphaerica]
MAATALKSQIRKQNSLQRASSSKSAPKGGDIERIARSGTDVTYTVDLSSINIKDVPDLGKYKHCKSLDLSCNQIKSIYKDTFQCCSYLKEIKLYSNHLSKVEGVRELQHLENLQLQYNNISKINNSLSGCRSLKFLRLDSNKISVLKGKEFCSLHQLTYLDISANQLEDISFVTVLPLLQELHCTHNKLTEIPDIMSLKKLQEIDLSHNTISNVTGLKGLANLNILCVKNNFISSMTSVKTLKTLTELNVSNNKIKCLSQFKTVIPSIEILNISCNHIENIDEILQLKDFQHLKEVEFLDNPVLEEPETDEQLKAAFESLDLVYLNGRSLKKQQVKRPTSAMRPMSANQLVSERVISNQLQYDEMCLSDFEDRINTQFIALQGLLSELPKQSQSPEKKKSLETKTTSMSSIRSLQSSNYDRPSSRCSSRQRLTDALSFAEKTFKDGPTNAE